MDGSHLTWWTLLFLYDKQQQTKEADLTEGQSFEREEDGSILPTFQDTADDDILHLFNCCYSPPRHHSHDE
jgi:hypothetical protein